MKKIDIYDKTFYVTLLIVTVVVTVLFIKSDKGYSDAWFVIDDCTFGELNEPNEWMPSIVDDGVCLRGDQNEPDCKSCHLADPLLEKETE